MALDTQRVLARITVTAGGGENFFDLRRLVKFAEAFRVLGVFPDTELSFVTLLTCLRADVMGGGHQDGR